MLKVQSLTTEAFGKGGNVLLTPGT